MLPEVAIPQSLQRRMNAHPVGWENHVNHSDFGLVITFVDEVLRSLPQSAAYIVNLKRLYRDDTAYSMRSEFGAMT